MSLSTFGQSILFSCLFLAGARVQAAPVTYTFTGTLQQPYDGSTSFSGTLVYNTDLPTYPGITPSPGWAYYSAVPSDPTAPVSSLTFQFGNTPSSALGTVDSLEVVVNHNSASDGFFIQEQFSGSNVSAEFGMSNNNLVQPGPLSSLAPPSALNLADFNNGANLTLYGPTLNVIGTITSLTPSSPVPEPSTALVFATLGVGFVRFLSTSRRLRRF